MENFEEHLMKKYPHLFYSNEEGELECPCGAWVPDGWQTIIDELCGSITRYIKNTYRFNSERIKVYPPDVKIDQIKEKFGGLRFYYSGGDDQVQGMVTFAEYLCSKTCEVTGEKGELCIRGAWYKTLSPNLREEPSYTGYKPTKQYE